MAASRAAFIGGTAATSNTLAGKVFGIPVSGTMAHSWVMIFGTELEAFEKYAAVYPDRCVLLVDTNDTLGSGVPNAITVFRQLLSKSPSLMAVRIDSGDLGRLAGKTRRMLDDAGLGNVKIYASSDLDEHSVSELVASGAPIDSFGVGTRLVTGWDDPALTGVYKIAAGTGKNGMEPRIKISDQPDKATNPGVKNVMRFYNGSGMMMADLLFLEDGDEDLRKAVDSRRPVRFHPAGGGECFTLDSYTSARELLAPVMKDGKILAPPEPLPRISERRAAGLASLGDEYRGLAEPASYPVCPSDALAQLKNDLAAKAGGAFRG
jgi:nicotinate phosphoribosyltransferase